jgi:hypothetical protein
MALIRKISNNALVLQNTDAEVTTAQLLSPHYDFNLTGQATIPLEIQMDASRFVEASFNIYRATIGVIKGGTSQYRIRLVSYDLAGGTPITHINTLATLATNNTRINLVISDSLIPANRNLTVFITEEIVGTPAEDINIQIVSEDFSTGFTPLRNGHVIQDTDGVGMPQRANLQFKGFEVSDDLANDKTVITNQTEIFSFTVAGPAPIADGIAYWRAPRKTIVSRAILTAFETGTITGVLEIDITKGSSIDPITMSTIFTTKPSIDYALASDYDESTNAVFNAGALVQEGEYLRLDFKSIPATLDKFQITIIGE